MLQVRTKHRLGVRGKGAERTHFPGRCETSGLPLGLIN